MLGLLQPEVSEITTMKQRQMLSDQYLLFYQGCQGREETILEMAEYKNRKLLCTDRYRLYEVQRYQKEIIEEVPEVDAVLEPHPTAIS